MISRPVMFRRPNTIPRTTKVRIKPSQKPASTNWVHLGSNKCTAVADYLFAFRVTTASVAEYSLRGARIKTLA